MTTPTNQEILDAVNTAIQAILTGGAVQSYNINGRNLTKYSLTELYNLRKELKKAIAAASGTGRNYAQFVEPT